MTALEEIKRALEGDMNTGLTAIDRLRFIVGGVPDFDPLTVEDADWIIAALESLQRENEELRHRLDVGPCGEDAIDVAESAADHLRHRAEAAEAEVKRYRVALIAAKTRMRNCRGAIESDQVVDKDVHGSLQNGIRDIQEALDSTGGEHHGN